MIRLLLAISGPLALLATTAIFSIHIAITVLLHHAPTRAVSLLSTALEAVVLIALSCQYSIHTVALMRRRLGAHTGAVFALGLFASTLAAAASIATIISLSKAPSSSASDSTILGKSFLTGASVTLGVSLTFQIAFMVIHFISTRAAGYPIGLCLDFEAEDSDSTTSYVKTIRYSQTSPIKAVSRGRANSMTSRDRPFSSGEKSYRPASSMRSSTSRDVRSMTSKTKLVSLREKRRPGSLDSYRTSADTYSLDEFPSFDKQIDGLCPPPKPAFLETIPASPTEARERTPSPSDFEPPRMARARSYSPASRTHERNSSTPSLVSLAGSELNIHPLFRSDSPTPPPMATPGTNVMASPNAGQVISQRHSVRDLRRMRSGSLPPAPSPLSRQNSTDDFHSKKNREELISIQGIKELLEEEEEAVNTPGSADSELPTPIPGWILTAGCRNSLTDYESRKSKSEMSI